MDLLAMDISEKEGQNVVLFLAFTNSDALVIFNVFHFTQRKLTQKYQKNMITVIQIKIKLGKRLLSSGYKK